MRGRLLVTLPGVNETILHSAVESRLSTASMVSYGKDLDLYLYLDEAQHLSLDLLKEN
jgi:hypothetical protein